MDIRDYENPFASSEEEIGQQGVVIDDETVLREMIRRIILQVL